MSRFSIIEFQLQQACNARCLYCACEQDHSEYHGWLPLEIVDRTLSRERPEWVWFEGGEVTMTEESKEYLLEAMAITNRYGVKNRINTNGHNLSPEWGRRRVAGGLQFACVSIAYRKTGTFTTMAYDLAAATLDALSEGTSP